MRLSRRAAVVSIAAAAASVTAASASFGAPLYWDTNNGVGLQGGSGTWSTGANNWHPNPNPSTGGGRQNWANPSDAEFTAVGGGTVTVAGTVQANSILFGTTGYTISSGTISLAGPTIDAGSDGTISAVLAGSAGITKQGAGILTLGSAHTVSGDATINAGTLKLASGGSLANITTFNINGAAFDTSANASATFSSSQTLKGQGTLVASAATAINGGLQLGQTHGASGTASTLTVSAGNLTLGATSTVFADLFSAGVLGSADKVSVSAGALAYGGTLKISNQTGAGPAIGSSWDLFDFTSRSGTSTFANNAVFGTAGDGTNLPTLSNGKWSFDYSTGVLAVVSTAGNPVYTLSSSAATTTIIRGGSTTVTSTLTNTNVSGNDAINYSNLGATPAANLTGSSGSGGPLAADGSNGSNAQTFSTATPGVYVLTPQATVTGVSGTTPTQSGVSGTTTITVLDHANASFAAGSDETAKTLDFGNVLNGASTTLSFAIHNRASNTTAASTADLKLTGFSQSGSSVISTDLAAFGAMAAGGSNSYTASLNTSTNGSHSKTVTLAASQLLDDSALSGAGQSNTGTLTLSIAANVGNATAATGSAVHDHLTLGAGLSAPVSAGNAYGTLSSVETNALGTQAILVGQAAATNTIVQMAWRERNLDETTPTFTSPPIQDGAALISDVVQVSGTGDDMYVLKVSYNPALVSGSESAAIANGFIRLMWLNPNTGGYDNGSGPHDDQWQFATVGSGTFAYKGDQAPASNEALGSFGVDTSGAVHYAWAVIDKPGQYAVVPEPASLGILAAGALGLLTRRRR